MNRKTFLKSAGLLASASMVSSSLKASNTAFFSKPNVNQKIKKGLSFYMIKEDLSIMDKFKLAKDLGFDGIEFNAPSVLPIQEVIAAKKATGLEVPSVVNKDHWSKPLSDPDPSVRQYIIDSIKGSMDEAKQVGADTVLVVPAVVNEKVSYEVAYNHALDSIKKLIPHVEKTGIKIGLENVWNNFLLSPIEVKQFIDQINHPLIGWYFDIGNVLRYGWPEHWIETLNSRIVKLHAKEFSRKKMLDEGLSKGFSVDLLQGDIDWALVMQKLKETNYNGGWMTVEVGSGDRNFLKEVSNQMDKILNL